MSEDKPIDEGRLPGEPEAQIGRTYGHFRVTERLGRGGMGIVYKATDTRLERVVALKFLPPILSDDDEARTRFATEARAASALDHPNICTVHDIGESEDGEVFIAMAYYDGETLEQMIARGAVSMPETLGYVGQVARGLAKAHAAGIIHRDIKPANVIVTEDGVVKILDFGLAKLQDVDVTGTGSLLGTVRYMSPEHTEGKPADHRSDIWAVGVLLYEMLAGQHPFKGDGRLAAIMYSILNEEPPSLTATNPRVPNEVERIVRGCLVKDPKRRYQTADELVVDIERTGFATGPIPGMSGVRPRTLSGRRAWVGIAAATVAGLALAIPTTRDLIFGGSDLSASSVAVLPITSTTNDPRDEALANGLSYSLATMLVSLESEEDSLRVVPASEMVSRSVTSVEEASRLFDVSLVLSGSFRRGPDGEGIVSLQLMQADPLDLVVAAEMSGPESAAFQGEIREALIKFFDLANDEVTRAVAENSPAPEAYPDYVAGLGYLNRRDLEDNLDNAIRSFEAVVAEDPDFALAHAGLCEARFEKYRETADTDLSDLAIESCDTAADLGDSQPAVLTSVGGVLLQTGEPRLSLRRIEQALALDSTYAEAHRWKGRYYEDQGEIDAAMSSFRRAIALRPDSWLFLQELAVLMAYSPGGIEDARELFHQIIDLTPDNYLAHNGVGYTSLFLNQVDTARVYFERSIELRENPIGYRNLGYLAMREARWAEAITALERGLRTSTTDWYTWRWMAHAKWWDGDREGAREAWRRMLALVEPLLEVNPNDTDLLIGVAEAHAGLGAHDQAREALNRALLRELPWNYQPYFVARTHEMLGNRESAVQRVVEAIERGYDRTFIENDPWLDPLRENPAFRAAIAAADSG